MALSLSVILQRYDSVPARATARNRLPSNDLETRGYSIIYNKNSPGNTISFCACDPAPGKNIDNTAKSGHKQGEPTTPLGDKYETGSIH